MDTLLQGLSLAARRAPALRRLLPTPVRRTVYDWVFQRAIRQAPDRVHMRDVILPSIRRRGIDRVLSIGCRAYCREIITGLDRLGIETWTLDIDPSAARWGAPGRHIVGDARRIDEIEPRRGFGCVILNGVLGFGIDTRPDIERTFVGLARILPPGALLVVGWNSDRADAPVTYASGCFDPDAGGTMPFPGTTHVYTFLSRNHARTP